MSNELANTLSVVRLRANEALFLPCVHSAAGPVVALGGIHRIEENLVLLTLLISRLLASVSTAVDDQIPIKCFLLRDTRSARLNKVFFFFFSWSKNAKLL